MNFAYDLCGGAPILKKYKIGATVAVAGIPLLDTSDAAAGVRNATTTSLANVIGVAQDTGTYTTTQSTTMTEGVVTVLINPFAIWRSLMVGSATSGVVGIVTNSSASAGGTVVTITTGDQAPNSPSMVDGLVVYASGQNGGRTRGITSVAATTATVTVPFPFANAVSDQVMLIPWSPMNSTAVTCILTTDLTAVRADQDSQGDGECRVVDVDLDFSGVTALRANSFLYFQCEDHVLKDNT